MNKVWSKSRAADWYKKQPWLAGCNYIPRTATNQLEMWQRETFSPELIDQELKWAASIGFNSIRVFLHNLLWEDDKRGFLAHLNKFLQIVHKHGIGVMLVLFDSVWHPFPRLGRQREPEPGVHNSGWVQAPGVEVMRDELRFNALKEYVVGVIGHFSDDPRVQTWDVWNEPDNSNGASYGPRDLGPGKEVLVANLLPRVFEWARTVNAMQPLTCGVWLGDWSRDDTLRPIEKIQIALSDVESFHCYGPPDDMDRRIHQLERFERPLLCTEYMSRGSGSTFQHVLPILKRHKVAAYNWGLVAGRTQTQYPWDSWQCPYRTDPNPWFHEIFHDSGQPYCEEETRIIRELTEKNHSAASKGKPRAKRDQLQGIRRRRLTMK